MTVWEARLQRMAIGHFFTYTVYIYIYIYYTVYIHHVQLVNHPIDHLHNYKPHWFDIIVALKLQL